jgi:hypothetical protein
MGPNFGLTPGWFWLRKLRPSVLQKLLTLSGLGDFGRLPAVRSIETLALIWQDAKAFEKWDAEKAASKMLSLPEETQTAWMEFIAKKGTPVLLPLLDRLTRGGKARVADAASLANWHIRLRASPNESFAELLQMQSIPWELGEVVKEHAFSISTAVLVSGLSCPEYSVAQHIEKELSKRTDIPEPEARSLLSHKSRYVRFGALASLINVATSIDEAVIRKTLKAHDADDQHGYFAHADPTEIDPEKLVLEYFKTLRYEQLLTKTSWAVDGRSAYRVLAMRHFDQFGARVRSDLDNEFAAVLSAERDEIRAGYREAAEKSGNHSLAERIAHLPYPEFIKEMCPQLNWDELEEYTRRLFISAALAGLVVHGKQSDVLYARKYLLEPSLSSGLPSGPRYRSEAVELLARFAEETDTETLRQIAVESYAPMRQVAAKALLGLAPGVNEISRQLMDSTDHEISNLAMESLAKCRSKMARGLLQDRLKAENASTRLRALKIVTRPMNRRRLEKLLERYVATGAYYYDVVCWMDRILYAPQPLRGVYRQQLESEQT